MWKTPTVILIAFLLIFGMLGIYKFFYTDILKNELEIANTISLHESKWDSLYNIERGKYLENKEKAVFRKKEELKIYYRDSLETLWQRLDSLKPLQIFEPDAIVKERKFIPKYKVVERNITLKEHEKYYTEPLTKTRFYVVSMSPNFDCIMRITPPNHETSEVHWEAGNVYYGRVGQLDRYFEVFVNSAKNGKVKLLLRIY